MIGNYKQSPDKFWKLRRVHQPLIDKLDQRLTTGIHRYLTESLCNDAPRVFITANVKLVREVDSPFDEMQTSA